MKSKKILIAALSLGLIFAPTKPLVFAAESEQTEADFATKRLNLIQKQEIVKNRTENEYKKIKAISDEALKILNSEKSKKTDLERNIQNLKTELEANPSNDRKIEIVTEIIDLENQLDQQNQKIDEIDQDYKEKEEKRAHYENIASVERYLLNDYRSAKRDIDIEIADAKYQIRVFRNQGLLDNQETGSFISEIITVSKTENPEDYIKIYESARAKAEQRKAEKLTENTETETDNQSPDQNETTAPNKEELKAAKESAIENLKSKTNLTETQEKLFEEAISNAENLEELAEINKKVDETEEEASKAKELSEAKDRAKQNLESSEHINSEQKADFEKQIEDAETVDQLLEIENNINQADENAKKEKASQELENAKTDLAEKLFSTSLNQDQKDSFLEKINKAADLVDLEAIDKEIEIASNQVDENIENETEKDPSNEETPSTPDPEEEKPKDEEKDPSEENPNEEEAGNLPDNQDDNTTEKPDPSNEDSVDDDNELENNPQNPDPDNGNNDSSDTSENVENTPTDNKAANGRENNTADGGNPEKTSPEGQRPRNTKITRPIFGNTNPVYRPLKSPHYLPSTITINETSTAKKVTIELKDDLKYLKKGTYKISDLEAKRDKIEAAIRKNKATVRAIGILEDLAPKTLAKNRAKINALLAQSQRLLAQANYALAEYNYLLSK